MAQEPDIDVGAITEALNNKTDTDVQNTTTIGSAQIAHLAMPSGTYDDITLKASGQTYTAPADGYFAISGAPSAAGNSVVMSCNRISTTCNAHSMGNSIGVYLPVAKDATMTLSYDGFAAVYAFRFIYAKGCEPQS